MEFKKTFERTDSFNDVDMEIMTERNRHISEIERDCHSLHDIQTSMATMVDEQGEALDQIEDDIENGAANTSEAVEALEQASAYQNKSSKKGWLIAGAGVTLVGVGLSVVLSPIVGIVTMGAGFSGMALSQVFN
jgi:t-SNARE complex subunit (syntaxin)